MRKRLHSYTPLFILFQTLCHLCIRHYVYQTSALAAVFILLKSLNKKVDYPTQSRLTNLNAIVTYTSNGARYEFGLWASNAPPSAFVAVALSDDKRLGSDDGFAGPAAL